MLGGASLACVPPQAKHVMGCSALSSSPASAACARTIQGAARLLCRLLLRLLLCRLLRRLLLRLLRRGRAGDGRDPRSYCRRRRCGSLHARTCQVGDMLAMQDSICCLCLCVALQLCCYNSMRAQNLPQHPTFMPYNVVILT